MLVMQKEEVKFNTPDIALKNIGINPYLNRARTKAARKTENASLASKLTNYVEYWASQLKVKTNDNNNQKKMTSFSLVITN